jgi:hypothetical protein
LVSSRTPPAQLTTAAQTNQSLALKLTVENASCSTGA